MTVDRILQDAVAAVWRTPAPGPDNLLQAPAFLALAQICDERYGGGKLSFSLSNALYSLGMPCALHGRTELTLDPEVAAERLDIGLSRKTAVRRYLCPLDLAEDLPHLTFGHCQVAQFDREQLAKLFDAERLLRLYPAFPLDTQRLAQFHWLVVDEEVALDPRPEARATPIFFADLSRDLGEIDPHVGRFPPSVESALFFLLLAPWEDWSTMPEVDWRGFRMPWIYMMNEDICVRPLRPPTRIRFLANPGSSKTIGAKKSSLKDRSNTSSTMPRKPNSRSSRRARGKKWKKRGKRRCSKRRSCTSSFAHSSRMALTR